MTLFWFAEVLLESNVTEAEVVPTLAFARYAETLWNFRNVRQRESAARELAGQYHAFELVTVLEGVPVVRMKSAHAEVTRYPNSELAKTVRIRVLSRFADADSVAALYGDVCTNEGLPLFQSSPGSLSWEVDQMHLVVDVGPREQIHPARLAYFSEYPQVYRFSYPMPSVVAALLRGLLGHGQKKNQMFAALLSDLGRYSPMSRDAAVAACVLWSLRGKRNPPRVGRTEEAAAFLNRFLLEPLEKPPITVSRNDAVWRDAQKVSHRFDLAAFLLQDLHA